MEHLQLAPDELQNRDAGRHPGVLSAKPRRPPPNAPWRPCRLWQSKTAATWRCCLRPGPPPFYNVLLPVDGSSADGMGISALSVYERGTPPCQKNQHLGGARVAGRAADKTAANSEVAAVSPKTASPPRPPT